MEIFGFAIMLMSLILVWQTFRNGRWMKETLRGQCSLLEKQTEIIGKQTEMIGKQTEMIDKQTEMIAELKNVIVEESRLTRESLQQVLLKISEQIAGIPEKTVHLLREEKTKYNGK